MNDESPDSGLIVHHSSFRIPAAGTFPGWPTRVAEVTMLDPCGGSGHFVVAAFEMFVPMRMEEEGLSEEEAVRAVLRDNLFMLDIDPRCCQIATFNLLLAAWKRIGYRADLPMPNIACSGIAVEGQLDDWLRLAGDDVRLRTSLTRLHGLFRDAPTLGSLIDPADVPLNERLFSADYDDVLPLLERALAESGAPTTRSRPCWARPPRASLRAARLLGRQYTLVATNVPYLARGKQDETLRDFCEAHTPEAKNDLATVFLQRCLDFCTAGGTASLVLPQNWLFLTSYRALREKLLKRETWHLVARLGPQALPRPSVARWYKHSLITLSRGQAPAEQVIHGLDVSALRPASAKAAGLLTAEIKRVGQWRQLQNPDSKVALDRVSSHSLLANYAFSYQGIKTGDDARYRRSFWEVNCAGNRWLPFQGTVKWTCHYGGLSDVIDWSGDGEHHARRQGLSAWQKTGASVSQMGDLPASIYFGTPYDSNVSVIVPKLDQHSAGTLGILRITRVFQIGQKDRSILGRHQCGHGSNPIQPGALDPGCPRALPRRPARALVQRPHTVAVQRPSGGGHGATTRGRGAAAGLSLVGAGGSRKGAKTQSRTGRRWPGRFRGPGWHRLPGGGGG